MSASPREFVGIAARILAAHGDEAGLRAVVSRAYYGAHHAAKGFHAALPVPGSVGDASGSHAQLVSQLLNPGVEKSHSGFGVSRKLGTILQDLLRSRVLADYYLNEAVAAALAESSIRSATTILDVAEGFKQK